MSWASLRLYRVLAYSGLAAFLLAVDRMHFFTVAEYGWALLAATPREYLCMGLAFSHTSGLYTIGLYAAHALYHAIHLERLHVLVCGLPVIVLAPPRHSSSGTWSLHSGHGMLRNVGAVHLLT